MKTRNCGINNFVKPVQPLAFIFAGIQTSIQRVLTAGFLLLVSFNVLAAEYTYSVSLSGTDVNSGHTISVTGTATADNATNSLVTTSLVFNHESDPPVALPSNYSLVLGTTSDFSWTVTPTELRFVRETTNNTRLQWRTTTGAIPGPDSYTLELGAGIPQTRIFFFNENGDLEIVIFESANQPAGSSFLFGAGVYSVGGSVSGLGGSLTLQLNGGDDLTVNADGPFTFSTPLAGGSDYSVTVLTQPTGQTCTVTNGSGTIAGADVDGVAVECVDNTARFSVSKTYSDGNADEVEVTLTCNTGLPLEQTFTIAGGDPKGVTFVVTDIPESGADCAITETGTPSGYTTILNDGAGCAWEDVALGDSFDCAITNVLNSKEVHVIKHWVVDDTDIGSIDPAYRLELFCDGEILGGTPQGESGLWYRELYSGDSLGFADHDFQPDVYPNWDGGTNCWVNETVYDNAIETGNGCGTANAPGLLLEISGPEPSCTITNTVFYEGIPILNQFGLAIMSLLMLGIGFVGLRRLM